MSWWHVSHKLKFQMNQMLISRLVSSARGVVWSSIRELRGSSP